VLSSLVIFSLMENIVRKTADADAAVVFFSFDFRDPEKHVRAVNLLRSLLAQVAVQNSACSNVLQRLYEDCGGFRKPSPFMLKDALVAAFRQLPKVLLVIDALDECADHEDKL